jgi:hypothetical protein
MTPAWAQRQEALLHDCIVPPDVFDHMVERLRDFAVPEGVPQVLICYP